MLYRRIKENLDQILDVAYQDLNEAQRKKLKWYRIYILTNEKKSTSGKYFVQAKTIEVYNPRLGMDHMIKTCLHELAHHVDHTLNRGEDCGGHGKSFYAEYEKLIYAALDMNMVSRELLLSDTWSSDSNKVKRIVERYKPKAVEFNPKTEFVIKVYNAFAVKEKLKSQGFVWNKVELTWEKQAKDISTEEAFLSAQGIAKQETEKTPYYVIEEAGLRLDPVVFLEANGETYEAREHLKKQGFYYEKSNNSWRKRIKARDIDKEIARLMEDENLKGIKFIVPLTTRKKRSGR